MKSWMLSAIGRFDERRNDVSKEPASPQPFQALIDAQVNAWFRRHMGMEAA